VQTELKHRHLGLVDYHETWQAMRDFTHRRTENDPDEVWTLEHPPVYTRGQRDHVTAPIASSIPVIDIDRGGLITYHGPGQLVVYVLVDLRRAGLGIRSLVNLLEQVVIDLCADEGIGAARRDGAPGVYVDDAKLGSLGLRVRNARSYHGLSINVNMDLEPFTWIEPCGLEDIQMTQLSALGSVRDVDTVAQRVVQLIAAGLGAVCVDASEGLADS